MNVVLVIVVIVAVLLIIAALVARQRRANDGVDSFRRQIDALSPEARRPVVDQVQSVAGRQPSDDADEADEEDDDEEPGAEDGARGT